MADEGGVSAALLELDDPEERRLRQPGRARTRPRARWVVAGGIGIAAIGLGWVAARRSAAR